MLRAPAETDPRCVPALAAKQAVPAQTCTLRAAARREAEIGVEGGGAVDVSARQPELPGDPIHVVRHELSAGVLGLPQASQDPGAIAPVAAFDLE